jgi:hypothetical protein
VRYSDGLQAGRPGLDSPQGQEMFLYSIVSRQALGPIQLPIHWLPETISSEVKRQERVTTHLHLVPRLEMVELYLHSPTRLHGVVLN